jgi:ComF family protein
MTERFGDKIRTFFSGVGYTCDGCETEIFNYPRIRLCKDCADALERNDENSCPKCGRKTRAVGVCLACKRELPAFDVGLAPFTYQGLVASFVNRLKNGDRYLSNLLGEAMAEYYLANQSDRELIVTCVPLTESKTVLRGYNQAEALAQVVAKLLNVEFDGEILIKQRETPQQKHLSSKERRENVVGAYRVHKRTKVKEKTILLIDDIMTTGATGSECARVLKNAGASKVIFLTASSLKEKS